MSTGASTARKLAAARRRIAELEAENAALRAGLDAARGKHDVASTTAAVTERAAPPARSRASRFGFGRPITQGDTDAH